ncbi:MAG: SBBP repeat-containing protein [Acidobacteriota bacterium]|nr:MAG: SBBP repeat-containing protein [Acidobacteriota bacterium]
MSIRTVMPRIYAILIAFTLFFLAAGPNRGLFRTNAREQGIGRSEKAPLSPGAANPLFFEENRGQFDRRVRFKAVGTDEASLFLTDKSAVHVLLEKRPDKTGGEPRSGLPEEHSKTADGNATAVYVTLTGTRAGAVTEGRSPLKHRTNHYLGKDPSKWVTGVSNFAAVSIVRAYEGIDVEISGSENGSLRYTIDATESAALERVEFLIEGAEGVTIGDTGEMTIRTRNGKIVQSPPRLQNHGADGSVAPVTADFYLRRTGQAASGGGTSFTLGIRPNYGRTPNLPVEGADLTAARAAGPEAAPNLSSLAYSTFVGGNGAEVFPYLGITVDSARNVYIAGQSGSTNFPTTPGSFDTTAGSGGSAVITKINPAGDALIYSTYLHSQNPTLATDIAVDSTGNAYVTGCTGEADFPGAIPFPTTVGAFDTTFNGGNCDVFVTKFDRTGGSLEYSTFIGGSDSDWAYGLALDSAGSVYVTGFTVGAATPYPTTPGAFDGSLHGSSDVFVTKLNPAGSALEYSTFIGGSEGEQGNGIAVDATGNAYVTGFTLSNVAGMEFPTTGGAYDTSHNGQNDVFVVKLNAAGSALVYSTFLGDFSDDRGNAIAVDAMDRAYVTGRTDGGTSFPTTPGAFDQTGNGGIDGFVTRLNPAGAALDYSTFLGSDSDDIGYGIFVDEAGRAFVTGETGNSLNTLFPTTPGAYDTTFNGWSDAFVSELDGDGAGLLYSTLIGGDARDRPKDIAVDQNGSVYITGDTDNGTVDFPTTPGAFDTTINSGGVGNGDFFVTKFGPGPLLAARVLYDFDGDGISDVSIFRPMPQSAIGESDLLGSSSQWWLLNSSNTSALGMTFGEADDTLVPADFTGDGRTDVSFFRPSNSSWYVLRSEDSTFFAFPFGAAGDIPAPGDFDGDGTADPAVYRPSSGTWFILRSSDGGVSAFPFGVAEDRPVVADYDGDGMDDAAIYRPSVSQWWQLRSSAGVIGYQFGAAGDRSVIGDYTGDGKADVAFFRPSSSQWFVIRSEDSSFFAFPWGANGDIQAPGDFDGDGIFDPAVFRPSNGTWYIFRSTMGFEAVPFGASGDIPIQSVHSVE